MDVLLKRCDAIAKLADCEKLISSGKSDKARKELAHVRKSLTHGPAGVGLSLAIRKLKRDLLFAPLERLVERMNMDQHW